VQSPIAGDTLSLIDSELVGRFLDHEEWACSHGLEQDLYLQIQSFRVLRKRIGESALEGSPTVLSTFKFPAIFDFIEDILAHRGPESP